MTSNYISEVKASFKKYNSNLEKIFANESLSLTVNPYSRKTLKIKDAYSPYLIFVHLFNHDFLIPCRLLNYYNEEPTTIINVNVSYQKTLVSVYYFLIFNEILKKHKNIDRLILLSQTLSNYRYIDYSRDGYERGKLLERVMDSDLPIAWELEFLKNN